MTERAGDAARFEPTAIGRRRTTGGLAVAGWVAVIVAVIGLALAGKVASRPTVLAAATAAPTNVADLAALVPAPGDPGLRHPSTLTGEAAGIETTITLANAKPGHATDQTLERRLEIKGGVLARASSLVIGVEAPPGRVLQWRGVSLPYPDGGIRPDQTPTVTVSFRLSSPADGHIWVDVTAFDSTGQAVANIYRELAVGGGAASSGWRSLSQSAIAK